MASQTLLADGAMGTLLHSRGTEFRSCFDALNLSNPEGVSALHDEYLAAGAQIILTNTFGANAFKLAKFGLKPDLAQINGEGVRIARECAQRSGGSALVAGDIGPLGVRIAPFGRVSVEDARQAFREQAAALAAAGVDLIVLETFSDLHELRAAVEAVRATCALPIVASMTYTRDDRTVLGDDAGTVARTLHSLGADVIGVNCSGGPAQLLRLLREMREAEPRARFWAKPNAGWPEQVGGRIMYPADADYFGDYVADFVSAGAVVIGGCCGTTPDHIAAMHKALATAPTRAKAQVAERVIDENTPVEVEPPSKFAKKLASGEFAISVEMDPPRGLSTHKLLAGASLIAEAGADVINVADSPMARMRMSAWAVCDVLQRRIGLETTLHFPTRGRNLLRVQGDLLAAHALGIRNLFVIMGDPTSIGDYPEATDNFDLVPSGLIQLIKQKFNAGVDQSGTSIGQPTNFFVGCALNLAAPDAHREVRNLERKRAAGADFILTQPIFDAKSARRVLDLYEAEFGGLPLPVLVGAMPLASARHARFLNNEVPGIEIPENAIGELERAGEQSAKVGIELAVKLIEELKKWAQGVYVMPQFSRYDVVADIIERVKAN